MLPTQPHHSISGAYRTPGGLRALDFFLSQVSRDAEKRSEDGYKILFCGPRATDFALPFAAMGFFVTVRFASEAEAASSRQLAEEVGVTADFEVGNPFVGGRTFDSVVLLDGWVPHEDLEDGLAKIHESLKDRGLLLAAFARHAADGHVVDHRDVVSALRGASWLPLDSENVSAVLAKAYATQLRPTLKRGRNKKFHLLDWLDGRVATWWPRSKSGGWLFACRRVADGPLVVQVIPTFSAAGAERVALSLAEGLPRKGYQVLTVANVSGGPLEDEFEKRGLLNLVLDRSGFMGRFKSVIRLGRLLADARPEVVQTHLFGADFWGRLAARMAGLKNIVTTEHNVRTDFGSVGRLVMRLMSGFSKRYVAISQQAADHLLGLGVSKSRIRLVPNGIDLPSMAVRPPQPMRDIPRLLFVGRLEPQKDPSTILLALARIRAPWQLTVAGSGSMERELMKTADDVGIAARINWLGSLPDASKIYAQHDAFLLPSMYEGFGLVAVEAAVAGLPIIASDLPVLRGVLTDDGATFVKAGDVAAWSEAIKQVMEDPLPAVERARRLAQSDWSKYSVESMVQGYARIYDELAGGRRPEVADNSTTAE